MSRLLKMTVAAGLLACPAYAELMHIDTFDVPSEGGWAIYHPGACWIEPEGGNPGAYLRGFVGFSLFPTAFTQGESVFTGDYYSRQVTSIGVDVSVLYVAYGFVDGHPLSVVLWHDNGTPWDPYDDWGALAMGENIPEMGAGWAAYDFAVPSQAVETPPGWTLWAPGVGAPPQADWHTLMTDVSRVTFMFGNPDQNYLYLDWEVGIDNARIAWVPEPATAALTLLGGLAVLRGRRGGA